MIPVFRLKGLQLKKSVLAEYEGKILCIYLNLPSYILPVALHVHFGHARSSSATHIEGKSLCIYLDFPIKHLKFLFRIALVNSNQYLQNILVKFNENLSFIQKSDNYSAYIYSRSELQLCLCCKAMAKVCRTQSLLMGYAVFQQITWPFSSAIR